MHCGVRGSLEPPCNAVGYIDRYFLGEQHLYRHPVYQRTKVIPLLCFGVVHLVLTFGTPCFKVLIGQTPSFIHRNAVLILPTTGLCL